jgi:predicted TIM-barrel fold metal-dependent hydrolase
MVGRPCPLPDPNGEDEVIGDTPVIIDADCHISSSHLDDQAMTASELIALMEDNGVDKALIWLKPPYMRDIAAENEAIYRATREYPGRFLGFGWVNPRLGRQTALDTIKCCFEEYGFCGVKFNGAQDEYVVDDPVLVMPLIEAAAAYGKPIAFHIGADFYENTHPVRLGRIASAFPEVMFLMVHMGGAGLPALDRSAIEVAAGNANIVLIGSNIHELAILRAVRSLGAERVCFGSDAPFRLQHVQLAMYRALLRDFDDATRNKVLGNNMARLLLPTEWS